MTAERSRLRIVAHNGSSILGGGEIAAGRMLAGFQRRGHDVHLLCRDERIGQRIEELTGVTTTPLRIGGSVMVQDAVRFAVGLRRLRPDALILTTFKKVALAGLGARLAGVPRVVQRIGLTGDVPRGPAYRLALRRFVDVVALNAESLRPDFLAADPGLPEARVVTIQDGVEVPRRTLPPGAFRKELGIPAAGRVVGSVARLASQKRFDRLLKAAARLPADVHVVLVGEGSERDALASLAMSSGSVTGFTCPASARTSVTSSTRWMCLPSRPSERGWRTRCSRRWLSACPV